MPFFLWFWENLYPSRILYNNTKSLAKKRVKENSSHIFDFFFFALLIRYIFRFDLKKEMGRKPKPSSIQKGPNDGLKSYLTIQNLNFNKFECFCSLYYTYLKCKFCGLSKLICVHFDWYLFLNWSGKQDS